MFNVQTINCMQYSEPVVIQTRSQSRNEILYSKYTHGTLSSKTQQFPLIEKKPLVLNDRKKKKRRQERKTNRIITVDGENRVSETSHKQNHRGNHNAFLN